MHIQQQPPKKSLHRHQRGASLTGYGLIVGLIAVVALSATGRIGTSITSLFDTAGNKMESVISDTSGSSSGDSANQAPAAAALSLNSIQEANAANAVIGIISATDPEGDNVTYSLAAGGDNAFFQIGGINNNALQAIGVFAFSAPQDADGQNDYDITITATDDGSPTESSVTNLTVTVTAIDPLAWDVANAAYDTLFFDAGNEDAAPTGLFFSADGTRLYVAGVISQTVYQYDLGTAWNVSTASFINSVSLGVTNQPLDLRGLFFKADGTIMYAVGADSRIISQYALSTPWDISSALFSTNLDVSSEGTSPNGLFFKPDGMVMYVIDRDQIAVAQYDLGTAWDVSTAVFNIPSFSVSSQEFGPTGLFLNNIGTRLFIVGTSADTVFQYDLGTAWDITTASYTNSINFSISGQEGVPQDLFFRPDGRMMFIIGSGTDNVFQYSLD